MTLQNVLTFAQTQSQTDSNGITSTNGIVWANEALLDFHRQMLTRGVNAQGITESYCDAQAGIGQYNYPPNFFFLKAIELNYTDNTQNNYITAQQVDVSNLAGQNSFSWLRLNCQTNAPQFNDYGNWYEIFPTPQASNNLSQLIRIWWFQQPTQYVATTDIVQYPENLDVGILGWRIAASYLYSLGTARIPDGDKFYAQYQAKVQQYISTLVRGSQQPTQAQPLLLTGFEY